MRNLAVPNTVGLALVLFVVVIWFVVVWSFVRSGRLAHSVEGPPAHPPQELVRMKRAEFLVISNDPCQSDYMDSVIGIYTFSKLQVFCSPLCRVSPKKPFSLNYPSFALVTLKLEIARRVLCGCR